MVLCGQTFWIQRKYIVRLTARKCELDVVVASSKPPLVHRFEIVAGDEGDRDLPLGAKVREGALVPEFRVQKISRLSQPEHVRLHSLNLSTKSLVSKGPFPRLETLIFKNSCNVLLGLIYGKSTHRMRPLKRRPSIESILV